VCGNLNGFSNDASARYQTSQAPELVSSFIDFEFDGVWTLCTSTTDREKPLIQFQPHPPPSFTEELPNAEEDEDFEARPVFVAAVDLSGV